MYLKNMFKVYQVNAPKKKNNNSDMLQLKSAKGIISTLSNEINRYVFAL